MNLFKIITIIFILTILGPTGKIAFANDREIVVVLSGDVFLARYIGKLIKRDGKQAPFSGIKNTFINSDIAFCNLESVFGTNEDKLLFPKKAYSFYASTETAVILKDAGFTVVNLANNHAMDYGSSSLQRTIGLLDREGLFHVGAGADLDEARRPVIIEKKGTTIGILGYGTPFPDEMAARKDSYGIAPIRNAAMKEDIKKLRSKADIIIVSLHWVKNIQITRHSIKDKWAML